MQIFPLIFGAISLLSPFVALIVYMMYIGKTAEVHLTKPLQAFLVFIPVPVLILLFDPQIVLFCLVWMPFLL
jgi:hypothetical protein